MDGLCVGPAAIDLCLLRRLDCSSASAVACTRIRLAAFRVDSLRVDRPRWNLVDVRWGPGRRLEAPSSRGTPDDSGRPISSIRIGRHSVHSEPGIVQEFLRCAVTLARPVGTQVLLVRASARSNDYRIDGDGNATRDAVDSHAHVDDY